MIELNVGEYKLLTEYDTIEEMREAYRLMEGLLDKLELTKKIVQEDRMCTFGDLEVIFIEHKRKLNKVSESSYKMYGATFTYLKNYFNKKSIQSLRNADLDSFQQNLMQLGLKNKTINGHMAYLKSFLDVAVKKELLDKNIAEKFDTLKEEKSNKENFEDIEVLKLIAHDWEDKAYNNFFKVAAYTGMRISEILAITRASILNDKNGFYFFNVEDSKTQAGIRQVPMHKELEDIEFPLFEPASNQTFKMFVDSIGKKVNRKIHSLIEEKTKTCHSFRGTFINELVNEFPEKISVIQEIVGHSKGDKSLTCDTYSKGFDMSMKYEMVNKVKYTDSNNTSEMR